jgi:hypothetical protein
MHETLDMTPQMSARLLHAGGRNGRAADQAADKEGGGQRQDAPAQHYECQRSEDQEAQHAAHDGMVRREEIGHGEDQGERGRGETLIAQCRAQQKDQEKEEQGLANGVGHGRKAGAQRGADAGERLGVVQVGRPGTRVTLPKIDQRADEQHAGTHGGSDQDVTATIGSRIRPIKTLDHEIRVCGHRRRT